MSKRNILRGVGLAMLVIAAVFVAVALQNPQMGRTVTIAGFRFGAAAWRVLYAVYLLAALGLLAASFFPGKRGRRG